MSKNILKPYSLTPQTLSVNKKGYSLEDSYRLKLNKNQICQFGKKENLAIRRLGLAIGKLS
jgi:hypothetical protein